MVKQEWIEKGYIDEQTGQADLKKAINDLKVEKKAVILAHYYQLGEIQDIADVVGDSLALAQWATTTDAEIIVMCGVHFMGETAKILLPTKKVIVPDLNAGCSLANSCEADKFEEFLSHHPGSTVITYVNTSAAVKSMSDIVVTSSNALKIVESLPKDAKIVFGPDRNLGKYIINRTGRDMVLWDGACHVHDRFSSKNIIELKKKYPDAAVIAHPECCEDVLALADFTGSTSSLLKYITSHDNETFIVATESGILHEMKKRCPDKKFIIVSTKECNEQCNECEHMKVNNLQKLYNSLKYEWPQIEVDEKILQRAAKPIERMLELSKQ